MTQTLSVALPASTVYVSGTVNDVAVTWTMTGAETWEAVADRAADDIYHVMLTIVNSSGTSTNAAFTLYYGLQLITDRTQADVDRGSYLASLWVAGVFTGTDAELAEWNSDLKGSYNASDLNRVGSAMNYVANRFTESGYHLVISPRIDWTEDDIPRESDMAHYLADLNILRGVLAVMPTTPEVPADMDGLTYQEANNIEQILLDIDSLITRMMAAWFYCGDLYCGEV